MTGLFISIEGGEGTGKTTQVKLLAEYLAGKGLSVVQTLEPGGTYIGRRIRELLLSTESTGMAPFTELLLYNAARVQLLHEVILPALGKGSVVVTDRFSDSTLAYQGYGRQIDMKVIDSLDALATGRLRPDLTFLLDIDVETGLRRNKAISKQDRLELEDISFHDRVRKGFIGIYAKEQERFRILDCSRPIAEVHRDIVAAVEECIAARRLSHGA